MKRANSLRHPLRKAGLMTRFRFLTAGESHGRGMLATIEGVPAGLTLTEDDIASDLKRRQVGHGRSQRMRLEQDRAEVLSGVRYGVTIGSPIALLIWNRDWENWVEVMSVSASDRPAAPLTQPRPGHADLAGATKYGLSDIRPILERSSARETAARVAVGAVARVFLSQFGVAVHSRTLAIGGHWARRSEVGDWAMVEASPVRCDDPEAEKAMISAIDEAAARGDTLGGVFEVVADGVPVGLGSHVHWDRRLDGRIAQAMVSINSVKGVEIGPAFRMADSIGSQVHDPIEPSDTAPYWWKRGSNQAGGIEGGTSNGQPVVVRAAVKPVPTLRHPLGSVDISTREVVQAHFERSDVCIVPAAGVIGEAMLAIVLADAMLEKFGGDNLSETLRNYRGYLESIQG